MSRPDLVTTATGTVEAQVRAVTGSGGPASGRRRAARTTPAGDDGAPAVGPGDGLTPAPRATYNEGS